MVNIDSGTVVQVASVTTVATYLLRTFVPFLQKKDPRIIAVLSGLGTILVGAFAPTAPVAATLAASGACGVGLAGLVYDKVLKPVVATLADWFHAAFPNA